MAQRAPPVRRQDRAWQECHLSADRTCNSTTGETITINRGVSLFVSHGQTKKENKECLREQFGCGSVSICSCWRCSPWTWGYFIATLTKSRSRKPPFGASSGLRWHWFSTSVCISSGTDFRQPVLTPTAKPRSHFSQGI